MVTVNERDRGTQEVEKKICKECGAIDSKCEWIFPRFNEFIWPRNGMAYAIVLPIRKAS